MLYVVATPIGNLSDFTFRAVKVLKDCDYILCEDTRHSAILLNHYEIKKPLKSFHKFNEMSRQEEILNDLRNGFSIGLISDAGTPGISDPGEKLVQMCRKHDLPVTPLPGACAAITALCCSGLDTTRFQFIGFLPKKAGELRRSLQGALAYVGTTICYESPNRLIEVLKLLQELAPERQLVVARELTKQFEEVKQGKAGELISYWEEGRIKGEIVVMISASSDRPELEWETLTPMQHVEFFQETYGMTRQEAILNAAKTRGVSKREVYNAVHQNKESF